MITTDAVFRILALCTSLPGSATVSDRLRGELHALASWDSLLEHAEANGLEPLLRAHLLEAEIQVPPRVAEYLTARWMQHAHAHAVRTRVIAEVLTVMEDERIPLVLLKGAALAHLVYDNPLLRPMRDVDVLVRGRDTRRAAGVLTTCGFAVAGPPVPSGHHHSRAMSRTVDEATVTIELHHQLLQPTPFLRRFEYDDVCGEAQPLQWASQDVLTLGREHMLWHVYSHAFAINVTRPAVRFISVADLVALTERWIDEIDWERVRCAYGRVWRALPCLHYLTPWSPRVLEKLRWHVGRTPAGVRPIAPRLEWSVNACRDVVWPPEWWLWARYGIRGWPRRIWCRAVEHPLALVLSAAQFTKRRWATPMRASCSEATGGNRDSSSVQLRPDYRGRS